MEIEDIEDNNTMIRLCPFTLKDRVITSNKHTKEFENMNIGKEIMETLKFIPTFVSLVNAETNEEVTCHEMHQKSIKCAMWLKLMNIMPGTLITICAWKTIDLYVPFLAGLCIGAIVNIWDRNCKLDLSVLRRTKPHVIFVDRKHLLQMYAFLIDETYRPVIVVFQSSSSTDFFSLDLILQPFTDDEVEQFVYSPINNANDLAVILYTLDMMNVERNIEISHLALYAALETEIICMSPETYTLWYGNLGSYLNLILFIDTILAQVTLIVWWQDDDCRTLCQLIDEYEVQWTYFNIEQIKKLYDFLIGLEQSLLFAKCSIDSSNDSTDDKVIISNYNASAIRSRDLQVTDRDVVDKEEGKETKEQHKETTEEQKPRTPDMMGILELENINLNGLECLVHDVDLKRPWIHDVLTSKLHETRIIMLYMYPEIGIISYRWGVGNHGKVGFINRNIQLKIVDSKGTPVGPNEEGEICCTSLCQMKGYYKQPMMTRSVIDQEGWLHTGDLGYYDLNCYIHTYGSVNPTIKYRDEIISIAEIETFLMKHKLVKEACILPIMDANVGQRPFAFLVKKYPLLAKHLGIRTRKSDIKQFIREGLRDSHNLNGGIMFIRQLPYTYFNTVDIKRLYRIILKFLQHEEHVIY